MICCILILKVISRHSTSYLSCIQWKVGVMVFNTTFNNISVISWLSDLLVEETGVPRENHRPVTSHWQMLSHNAVSNIPRTGFELTTLVEIGTDRTLCDKVCQWLVTGQWFSKVCQWLATGLWVSAGTLVSSTNKSDSHDITEILLKVALKHHNPYLPTGKSWYFRG